MPYKSKAQMRWAHTPAGVKALGEKGVAEFDAATKGKKLPEKKKIAKKKTGGFIRKVLGL